MQDDFDLDVVLSVLTGINFTDYGKLYEFFCFLFEDDSLNPNDIISLRNIAIKHIYKIHPELLTVRYDKKTSISNWISQQKSMLGNTITISVIGEKLITLKKQPSASTR